MTKLEDQNLDPVVVAAMIDDDDDEEGKEITAAALKAAGQEAPHHTDDLEDNDDDDLHDDSKDDLDDKKPKTDSDTDSADELDEHGNKKPPEAIDAEDDEHKDDEGLTRREKRAQRRSAWEAKLASKPPLSPSQRILTDPNYKPLDYTEGSTLDPNDLKNDRESYAKVVSQRAAAQVQYQQEQMNFWNSVDYQDRLLKADPKFAFLDETKKESYNEKRAMAINNGYLNLIGYKETPITDEQGRQIYDPATKQPAVNITVERNDIGFDEFAKQWLADMEDYADERNDDLSANLNTQRRNQGIRPGGGGRRNKAKVSDVGDISKLSDEEFERLDASGELDAAIAAKAGW